MARFGSASPSGPRARLVKTRAGAMRASCLALVVLILLLGPGRVGADDLVRYKCKELAILDVDQGTCACVKNATLAPGNRSTCACDKGSYFDDASAACTGCPAGYYKSEIGNDESLCAPCPWPSSVSEDASTCVCPEDKGLIFDDGLMNCTCVRDVHVETVASVIRLPYLYEIGENVSSTKPIGLGNLFTISSGEGKSSNETVAITITDGANKVNKTVKLTQDDELAVPVSTENATLEIVAEPGCLWRDDAIVSVAVVPLGFSLTSIVKNRTLLVEWTLSSTEWPVIHVYLERVPGLLHEIGSSRNGRITWPIPSSGIGLDRASTLADAKPISRSIWLSVSQGAEVDPVTWSLEKAVSTVTDIQYLRFVATTTWSPCDCSLDLPKETRKVECQRLSDAATLTYTAVPNAFCERAGLSEPDAERLCFACPQALSASWALDDSWSACSASACGTTGVRSRGARCWNASGEVTQDPTSVCGELASLDLEQNCSLLCEPVVLSSQIDSCTLDRCVDKWSGRALASSECQSLQASLGAENCETWSLCNQMCGAGETFSPQGESRVCNVRRCDPVVALYSPEGAAVCVSGDFYDVPCNESETVVSCDSFCSSSGRAESESDDLAGRRRRLSMTYLPESVISDELERRCPNSDVMTPDGSCCPLGSVLDRSGACCSSGFVDACGVCGGNGTLVDLSGKCCSEIDAEGFCCENGTDVLGVCAGAAVLHNASAECGNGICEVGEVCDNINDDCCADDCPFPVTYCYPEYGLGWSEVRPCGGLGKCLLAQGVCDCYSGAGRSSFDPFESCVGASSCAADHTWTAKGCIQDTALAMMLCTNGQFDEGESGVDCGGFCPFACDGTLSPTLPTPEPTSALQSAAGQIAPRVWIPIVSSLGALLMCACGVFAAVHFHNERLRKKLQAIKRKVDPDAHPVHGPSVAQREHESLPTKWSGRKSLTVPLDVAYRTFGATEEHPEGASSIDARLAELQKREEILSKEIAMEGWIEKMKGDTKQKRQIQRLQRKDGDDAEDDDSCADLTTDEEDHVAQHEQQQQQRLRKDKADTKNAKWARRRVGKTKQQANLKRAKRAVYGVLKPVGELLLYRDMVASGFGKIHMDYIETVNLRSMTHVKLDGHIFCLEERPRKDLPPLRSLRFAAANQTEAKEWLDTLLCLVHMFEDLRRPPESAISDSQEFLENVRDEGDATSDSDVADETEVTLMVRHVRSESQVDQTLAPPRTPAPSAPIPPTLPDKGARYRSISSPQRGRSRSQRRDRSKSRQKRGCAASAQTSAVTRRVARGRGSSVPPPLPPWPGDAIVDAERPKRTMSTGDLHSYRPQRTIREARAAGVSEYELNNDIWAEFQKSFAS